MLTASRLREVLDYQEETGRFFWKERPRSDFATPQGYGAWRTACLGKEAGSPTGNGYLKVCIDMENHLCHRLAWLYVHAQWPKGHVDHINGETKDNRIENLRDIPREENQRNMKRSRRNKSGVTGVYQTKYKTWRAVIWKDHSPIRLGSFPSKSEAAAARKLAEAHLGYHPNHGRAAP